MIMCTMKRILHRSLYICTSYRITEAEHRALKMGESCFKICQILNSKQILLLIQVRIDNSRTSMRLKGGRGKILILPKLGVTTIIRLLTRSARHLEIYVWDAPKNFRLIRALEISTTTPYPHHIGQRTYYQPQFC